MKIKSIIGAVLLLTVWALPGSAQIGEQRHNLAVGFNGGININSVSFSPTVRQTVFLSNVAKFEQMIK